MDRKTETELMATLKNLTEAEYVKRIRSRFIVRDVDAPNVNYIRVGKDNDGGYVMFDDFDGVKVAYSFGIGRDVSWDEDMAARGIDIFMYDHEIDALPKDNPKFHWSKTGLTGVFNPAHPELETLPRLIEQNGHADEHNMILKMDIEASEYNVLKAIDASTLKRFKQLAMEFHGLMHSELENAIGLSLDKLNVTHQLVHVHGNNFSGYIVRGGLVLPEVIECTYLRRSDYAFVDSQKFFPTELDMPCHPTRPEINLGYWG